MVFLQLRTVCSSFSYWQETNFSGGKRRLGGCLIHLRWSNLIWRTCHRTSRGNTPRYLWHPAAPIWMCCLESSWCIAPSPHTILRSELAKWSSISPVLSLMPRSQQGTTCCYLCRLILLSVALCSFRVAWAGCRRSWYMVWAADCLCPSLILFLGLVCPCIEY